MNATGKQLAEELTSKPEDKISVTEYHRNWVRAKRAAPKTISTHAKIGPWDRLLTLREVAALRRVKLQTVIYQSKLNWYTMTFSHGQTSIQYVWLSQVIDWPFKNHISDAEAAKLVEPPREKISEIYRRMKHPLIRQAKIGNLSVIACRDRMQRYRNRVIRNATGQVAPSSIHYKYAKLAELDAIAENFRNWKEYNTSLYGVKRGSSLSVNKMYRDPETEKADSEEST